MYCLIIFRHQTLKKDASASFLFSNVKFQSLSDETWRRVVGAGVVFAITLTDVLLNNF